MSTKTEDLLLAALLDAHQVLSSCARGLPPDLQSKATTLRESAERMERRIEHATGWGMLAITGNDDIGDADMEWNTFDEREAAGS